VTVQDANLCTFNVAVTITQPAVALGGSISSQTNVLCFGNSTGAVTVAGSGGTGAYQYKLGAGAYQASGTFSGLSAGPYTVTVQDANLCTFNVAFTITQPVVALGNTGIVTNVTINGGSDGAINITITGGTAPYTYLWSTVNGSGLVPASEDQTGIKAGTYNVLVTDSNGCTVTGSYIVTQPVSISVTGVVTSLTCNGSKNGVIILTVSGGAAPYTYVWSTSNGSGLTVNNKDQNGLSAGTYNSVVTDKNGLILSSNFIVTEPPAINLTVTVTNVKCKGGSDGIATAVASGGTGPLTYSWSLTGNTPSINSLFAGNYTSTVTDATGCTKTQNFTISEPVAITITPQVTKTSCPGERDGTITLQIAGGVQPYTALWSDGKTTIDRTSVSDSTYSVIITDVYGCSASIDITVEFTGENCLFIPKVITPNGDGKNDTWIIKNIGLLYPDAELHIFNRWGKLIYRTKNIEANPWDGTLGGKLVPIDSYHYIIYLNNGSLESKAGVISVIR
jgi:gliding motility-associated-like protein